MTQDEGGKSVVKLSLLSLLRKKRYDRGICDAR
jgi:hypothetical protein